MNDSMVNSVGLAAFEQLKTTVLAARVLFWDVGTKSV